MNQAGSTPWDGALPMSRPNRFITAGVYGMSELELGDVMDELVTEVGFQSMVSYLFRGLLIVQN